MGKKPLLPTIWPVVPLGRIFEKQDVAPKPGDGVVTAFRDGNVMLRSRRRLDGFTESLKEIGYQRVAEGDLVIHSMDAFAGAIGVAQDTGKSTPVYIVLKPKENIYPKYYSYVLRAYAQAGAIQSLTQGIRERSTDFRWSVAKTLLVPIPPYEDQKRIADELDRELTEIDDFIAECVHLAALAEERRLSTINNVIEPLLGKTTAIKHLGSLTSGITLGAAYNEPTQTYPYLRVANVQVGRVDLTDVKEVSVPDSVANDNFLQKDDVLMTEGGDRDKLGRGAIWSGEIAPMLHQNHVFAFRCNKEKLLPEFLVYCLEASYARRYFENSARQSTNLASTNSTNVKNFKIPSATIKEQQKIIISLKKQTQQIDSIGISAAESQKILSERKSTILIRLSGG